MQQHRATSPDKCIEPGRFLLLMAAQERFVMTQENLDSLIKAFVLEKDYKAIGDLMGASRRATNENIQRFSEENRRTIQRRGGGHPKWDEDMHQFLINLVEDNPQVFLCSSRLLPRCPFLQPAGHFGGSELQDETALW